MAYEAGQGSARWSVATRMLSRDPEWELVYREHGPPERVSRQRLHDGPDIYVGLERWDAPDAPMVPAERELVLDRLAQWAFSAWMRRVGLIFDSARTTVAPRRVRGGRWVRVPSPGAGERQLRYFEPGRSLRLPSVRRDRRWHVDLRALGAFEPTGEVASAEDAARIAATLARQLGQELVLRS